MLGGALLVAEDRQATHTYLDSQRSDTSGQPRKPREPKLPLVAEEVPFETPPQDLVEFLTSVDWSVEEVRVSPNGRGASFHIAGQSSRSIPRGIPTFVLGRRAGAGTAHVQEFYSYGQSTDAARRKCAERRDVLVKWGSKLQLDPARAGETRKAPRSRRSEPPVDAPAAADAEVPAGPAVPREAEAPPA
jgi:hypothetical protein